MNRVAPQAIRKNDDLIKKETGSANSRPKRAAKIFSMDMLPRQMVAIFLLTGGLCQVFNKISIAFPAPVAYF